MPVDPRLKLAFQALVLARASSVEAAAARYGVTARTVRRWCWTSPISCRVAHGARRVSIPLCDVYAAGEGKALWALLDGDVAEIVSDAFDLHGAGDVLAEYAKKIGHRGHPGRPDVAAAAKCG
jgi:hypothetical protein